VSGLHSSRHNFKRMSFDDYIRRCKVTNNQSLVLVPKNGVENAIPYSIATLKWLRKFALSGSYQIMNVNALAALQKCLQTCIIEWAQLVPNMNDKSNAIYTLTNLRYLELCACKIGTLHDVVSKLTFLQYLLLPHNYELSTLPISMTRLTSLLHLSLKDSKIQSDTIISIVCHLPSLQVLQVDAAQQLETVPSQISKLTSLLHLSLSWTKITSLPTEIGLLTQMHTLVLNHCTSLSNIPPELCRLGQLTEFRASKVKMRVLPFTLKNWTKLEVLELDSCEIEVNPTSLWSLRGLTYLSLNNNQFSSVPPQVSNLSRIQWISLHSNKITFISNQIRSLTRLQVLTISSNLLKNLPLGISSLLFLTKLSVDNNKLRVIPCQLPPNLKYLDFSENYITSVPSKMLCSLEKLEQLYLRNTLMEIVPTEFALLTSLQYMSLDNNEIFLVPSDL